MTDNIVHSVEISRIINECKGVKTIIFNNKIANPPKPGQFTMIWVPGVDEIPMSISSYHESGDWGITVKNVGECTNKLHKLKIGDYIGVRGPLGNFFSIPKEKSKNIVLIGGGIGMAPLRFLSSELKRLDYKFTVVQGAKVQDDLIYMDEFFDYNNNDLEYRYCTDDGSYGEQGLATDIFERIIKAFNENDTKNTIVYACGPEVMMYKLLNICLKRNIEMYASLERIMRCGCGLCGLCALDPLGLLVCKDGPIFSAEVLKKLDDFGNYKRDFTGKKISIQ